MKGSGKGTAQDATVSINPNRIPIPYDRDAELEAEIAGLRISISKLEAHLVGVTDKATIKKLEPQLAGAKSALARDIAEQEERTNQ